MFKPYLKGTSQIIEGVTCYIPPVGMGSHTDTGELQPVEIIKRSSKKDEQYWERQLLPADFEKKVKTEKNRQETEEDYSDNELDEIRLREWHRRYYGIWFWNRGKLVYITGLHYFYMNYWVITGGYPDFRIIDLEKAYLWQVVVENPDALGMIEVRKRRDGKSFFAGCMLFECLSRTKQLTEGGIISINKIEAAKFFTKTIITPFKKLPSFFIPVWDTSSTLKNSLDFIQPAVKGKKNTLNNGEELGSSINFGDSTEKSYDGHQTKRLVVDEFFKTEMSCFARHLTVKYCARDHKRNIVGKILYTSTVEEIGVKYQGDKFWGENDQLRRLPVPDTVKRSGELYCFFMPSYRSGDYDKYGYCDESAEKQKIIDSQDHNKNNEKVLIADMRKNPFDLPQAFRTYSDWCQFNQSRILNRIDEIGWMDIIERGDFMWTDGQLSRVRFVPNKTGRFYMVKAFKFDQESDCNNVIKRGNSYYPGNTSKYVIGLDPYDHDRTTDGRHSEASFYVRKRYNPLNITDPCNKAFIVEYIYRQPTAPMMYDDLLKMCFYFGCPLLFESNKPGVKRPFEEKGCTSFLIHIAGYPDVGIPSTPENKRVGADLIEEEIADNIDHVYFKRLLLDWVKFDVNKTEDYDASMASMWTLFADRYRPIKRDISSNLRPITDYVKPRKLNLQLA